MYLTHTNLRCMFSGVWWKSPKTYTRFNEPDLLACIYNNVNLVVYIHIMSNVRIRVILILYSTGIMLWRVDML